MSASLARLVRVAVRFLRLVALPAALALSGFPAQALAGAPIRIGTVVWVGYGPFYVADALGMFKKAGLNVELKMFADPVEIPPAIAGGALQGGMVTYNQVLPQVEKGQMQKVVLPIDYSYGADAIVVNRSVGRIADFKGKKIGLVQLSPSDILLAYAMRKNGLAESDVTLINMAPDAVPPAMLGGQLAVGVTWEPMLSQILAAKGGKEFRVIYSSKDAPGVITDVLVFDEKFIQSNPKDIQTLLKVYLQALAYVKSKPDEAAKIIAKVMSITPKEVKEQMPLVRNLQPADIAKAFAKSDEPLSFFGSGPLIGEILKARGEIKTVPPIESTLEPRFAAAVMGK
ncbi:MAG: ABC transporter substrate-binding protein [Betaproteobacteria bacterium]|nr:ABC transporter substrate-binding protein [Betaproteobacteria bacterium]